MMIFSFLLEGLLSNYLSFAFFLTLTSIVFASTYIFDEKFIKYSLIIGILYDITYTNTLFLNGIIFFLIAIFILNVKKRYKDTILYVIILNLLIHFIYIVITYIILILFRYLNFNFIYLIKIIIQSYIIDTIYLSIIYFVYHKIKDHT